MITLGIILVVFLASFLVYTVPGLMLARGMYGAAVKELNLTTGPIVPPRPDRPEIKESEFLHVAAPVKCSALRQGATACNCRYRKDWIKLKNDWIDYNEWQVRYGHIKNPLTHSPTINMTPIYLAVIGWPVVAMGMYIKGGAKNIPDYRAIERMENELKELD